MKVLLLTFQSNLKAALCVTGTNDTLHSPLLQAFILCIKAYDCINTKK